MSRAARLHPIGVYLAAGLGLGHSWRVPRFQPFQGVRYDTERLPPASLLAPPYDIVTAAERERLARDSHNVVHLELPLDEDGDGSRYRVASNRLRQWLDDGILKRDVTPRFYPYRQKFAHQGKSLERRSVFGLLELLPLGKSSGIHPHEFTLRGPRQDRLRLLAATGANLSPIFLLYSDATGRAASIIDEAMSRSVLARAETPWQGEETLWSLAGEAAEELSTVIGSGELIFADGHHRYESALEYHLEQAEKGGSHGLVLAALSELTDPGLLVLPTHRIVNGPLDATRNRLAEVSRRFFSVTPFERRESHAATAAAAMDWLAARKTDGRTSFIQATANGATLEGLDLKEDLRQTLFQEAGGSEAGQRRLDVVVLHALLEVGLGIGAAEIAEGGRLSYTRDASEALAAIDDEAVASYLLNSTPVSEVTELATQGLRMPQKSTYFYPKLTSGWLFHVHDGSEGVGSHDHGDEASSFSSPGS